MKQKTRIIPALILLCFVTACSGTIPANNPEVAAQKENLKEVVAEGYQTPIPQKILTPDKIENRLGTLEFFDGLPTTETVEKAYGHLDFMRGVRTF